MNEAEQNDQNTIFGETLPTGIVKETIETTVTATETALNHEFFGNSTKDYITSISVALIVWILLFATKTIVINRYKKIAKRTKNKTDDIFVDSIEHINFLFYLSISVYIASFFLFLPDFVEIFIRNITLIIIIIYGAIAVKVMVVKIVEHHYQKRIQEHAEHTQEYEVDKGFLSFIKTTIQIVIWLLVILLILQNVGFNVGALVGGLGIAGIALAFGLQNVLSDLFAYVSIFLDKPFKVGDFIITNGDMGVVRHIGIKTTRIQTLQGQELVLPNKELTESRINNYAHMNQRRIAFTLSVVYGTPLKKLKKIPDIIKNIIESNDNLRFDRTHFKTYGPYSLDFEVVYYVKVADHAVYMDCQQDINFLLFEQFEKEGIEFAFPTQTVIVNKPDRSTKEKE